MDSCHAYDWSPFAASIDPVHDESTEDNTKYSSDEIVIENILGVNARMGA